MLWSLQKFASITAAIIIIGVLIGGLYVLDFGNMASGWNNVKGNEGKQGDKGKQGEQGVPGPQGPPGQQGIQGVQGIQGIIGKQGVQGKNGISLIVVCYVNSTISCHQLKHSPFGIP